jgi:hypothetical protein
LRHFWDGGASITVFDALDEIPGNAGKDAFDAGLAYATAVDEAQPAIGF